MDEFTGPRATSWQEGLSVVAREALWSDASPVSVAAGEAVFSPSCEPDAVFLLESGLIRIYRLARSGAEVTFGFILPGEVFGELIAFGDFSRDSFAEALADSRVWRIGRQDFEEVVASRPDVALEITRQIIRRFKRMENRVEQLILRSVRERVIHMLLELARDLGRVQHDGIRLEVPLTQSRLATVVGASRQTVNECLRDLERAGMICLGGSTIRLQNPGRLAAELDSTGVSAGRQTWTQRISSLRKK